ncbi:MAG: hypothetical protein M3Y87_06555 [Myxococcota bacterium]|nr:hypothetical protein [Myxococcota bacterium]
MKIKTTIASVLFGAATVLGVTGCQEDPTETGSGLAGQEVGEQAPIGLERGEGLGDEGIQTTPQEQPPRDREVDLDRPAPGGATYGQSWQMQSGGAAGEAPELQEVE